MNNLLCAASHQLTPEPLPVGQVLFGTPGTYQWVCPEGVTEVSVLLVGAGGTGSQTGGFTGAGGNVRMVNRIPVIPGQIYNIFVPENVRNNPAADNSTTAFGYTAATSLSERVMGGDGTPARTGYWPNSIAAGGNAGFLPRESNGWGINLLTLGLVSGASGYSRHGGNYGGGGGFWPGFTKTGDGGRAAVRIIWGNDRAFPDQNIGDMR